jgi:hypothetical protein
MNVIRLASFPAPWNEANVLKFRNKLRPISRLLAPVELSEKVILKITQRHI